MSIITQVTPIGDFCRGLNEYCDDERCQGSYAVSDAEVLLQAEIPVLTLKRNAKAAAAFFNVPPHLVRSSRLHARVGYGKNSISQLMEAATGELMKRFSKTGIKTTGGRLLACHTKDNAILVVVYNPDMERELITEITLSKKLIPSPQPEVNREITLLREDSENSVFRALLPPNEVLVMVFS